MPPMYSAQPIGKYFYTILTSIIFLLQNMFEIVTIFHLDFSSLVEGKSKLLKG